jgi:hypothetical protein
VFAWPKRPIYGRGRRPDHPVGDLLKTMSWYGNEWGYANQMVREAVRMQEKSKESEPHDWGSGMREI